MKHPRIASQKESIRKFCADALRPHPERRKIGHLPRAIFPRGTSQGDPALARYSPCRGEGFHRLLIRRVIGTLVPPGSAIAVLLVAALMFPESALAAFDFFSINENAVIMYDAPSLKAGRLYVATRNLPVEAVVKVEGWVKVRDSKGNRAWVEEKVLSEKRFVIVTAPLAEAYQAPNTNSALVFKAQQDVIMEWLEPAANGWVKVRHRDGQTGYVRTTQVWGS
jgi:SH3-like domain-containing protein